MAGIGFELRHLLRKSTLTGLVQAYAYAAAIGTGPWVLSIVAILLIGLLSVGTVEPAIQVAQFQTSVTYLVAFSLIYTGLVQLAFTRFVSDLIYDKRWAEVLPNIHGLMTVVLLGAGALGTLALFLVFPDEGLIYRLLMLSGFGLLSGVWVLTIMLSGMKRYKDITALFALAYGFIVLCSLLLRPWGLDGLLGGFVLGHFILLAGMWIMAVREFHGGRRLVSFGFFHRSKWSVPLVVIGFLYNLGIWADKFMFWFDPMTSQSIIGGLRASLIYDLPVLLAYLSIIPAMAAFMVFIETDFADYNRKFYAAIRSGGSLGYIEAMRDGMVYSIRQGLAQIAKIQTLTVLVIFVTGPAILDLLGISRLYLPLLHVQVIGVSLQVGVMAVLNVFFYLAQIQVALWLSALFVLLNVALTGLSLHLGAVYYGYGFAAAQLVTLVLGLHILSRRMNQLEYRTFMLQ